MMRYENKVQVATLNSRIAYNMKVQPRGLYSDTEATNIQGGGYRCLGTKNSEEYVRIKFFEDCRKVELSLKRFASGAIARPSKKFAPGRDLNR